MITKAIKSISLLSTVLFMVACSNNKPLETNHDGHDHSENKEVQKTSTTTVNLKDEQLNAIYPHYQILTTALTDGNEPDAKIAAAAIELGAAKIKDASNIATVATKITLAKNLEEQRILFSEMSDDFIALIKKTGLSNGELFVAHCPMALNDKGANWLSNRNEIKNPYYGSAMLTCGSVTETLKQ